jgi:hypothetical protein
MVFAIYYSGLFFLVPMFRSFESSAWRMIVDRLIINLQEGYWSFNGLPLLISESSKRFVPEEKMPQIVENLGHFNGIQNFGSLTQPNPKFEIYTSQFGLVGDLASVIQFTTKAPIWAISLSLSLLTIFLSSAIASYFVLLVREIFGGKSSLVSALFFLLPWPALFASNYYYSIFANILFLLLPSLVIGRIGSNQAKHSFQSRLLASLFILTFAYSLSNYTYVTLWFVNILVGLFLINHKCKIQSKLYLQSIATIFIAFIAAFLAHLLRVSSIDLSEKRSTWAVYLVQNKIGFITSPIEPMYLESVKVSFVDLFSRYYDLSLLTPWISSRLPSFFSYLSVGNLLVCFLVVGVIKILNSRHLEGLFAPQIILVGLLFFGPFSWLCLMRPQSWENSQVNVIMLFMPAIPLIAGIIFGKSSFSYQEVLHTKARILGTTLILAYFSCFLVGLGIYLHG